MIWGSQEGLARTERLVFVLIKNNKLQKTSDPCQQIYNKVATPQTTHYIFIYFQVTTNTPSLYIRPWHIRKLPSVSSNDPVCHLPKECTFLGGAAWNPNDLPQLHRLCCPSYLLLPFYQTRVNCRNFISHQTFEMSNVCIEEGSAIPPGKGVYNTYQRVYQSIIVL